MMATWRSVVFPVMGHRPSTVVATMTQARGIESHGRAVGRGKLIEVSIVDREGGIPDAEVRAALDSMAPVVAPPMVCGPYAICAPPFSTSMRSKRSTGGW